MDVNLLDDESGTNSDQPFTIHSPTKITLSPVAQAWAREHFPSTSERESNIRMARYLLDRDRMRQSGLID
jgi:hypothetical protein